MTGCCWRVKSKVEFGGHKDWKTGSHTVESLVQIM